MRFTALLLLFVLALPAQDRDTRWRADAEALYQRVTTAHPNPYTRTANADFAASYQKLLDEIPALNDRQVVLGLARLAALANDAHTTLDFMQSGSGLRRYPIAFRWFSDGLFLTLAPEAQAGFIGMRVTRIGSRALEEAAEAIRPWISHDTESWFRYRAQTAFYVHELLVVAGLAQEGGPLTLELEDAQGARTPVEFALAGASAIEGPHLARPLNPLYRRNPNTIYWYAWIEESRTVYVQYNRCAESALLSMANFARELIEFAKLNRVDRWVFDIRENAGGSSRWFTQLMLALRLAYVSGDVTPPAHGAFGIIGKRTFSSGSLAASEMKQAGMILVGETTGGRVSWFGENLPITLPNSRLTATVSTRTIEVPGFGPAIDPDAPVDFRGADYFADRDPYLEKALTVTPPAVQNNRARALQ